MNKILPILSGSLETIISEIYKKTEDAIAKELLDVNAFVRDFNAVCFAISTVTGEGIIENLIDSRITDEARMISIRLGEFEVSYLPKGKDPEYGPNGTWSRKNRQTSKPVRLFQKLLKKEFKTREWEIFNNLFRAELCQCNNFQIVEGEDIRYWYNEDHYYTRDGTLGNSCMRYSHAERYFDVYVENAKMLISTKDGLLTGRAIVWEIDGITILDRIYTCFDYLENCFLDYAKEHGWWIRDDNSLLSTGDEQVWLTPDDNYCNIVHHSFELQIKNDYPMFPYMDSFRYYNGNKILTNVPDYTYALDSTDGDVRGETYTCASCGNTFYGYDDEVPDQLNYSNYSDAYFCDNCCWYSDGLEDYISNDYLPIIVHTRWSFSTYPDDWVQDVLVLNPSGDESEGDIVKIKDEYYFVTDRIVFNADTHTYEIRPCSN